MLDVGEEDRAECRFDVRLAWLMFDDAAHEALDHPPIDLDDLIRHEPVRGVVDGLDRVRARCRCQAERGLALFVEPVGQEADAELALDLEVLEVCGRAPAAVRPSNSWRSM